MANGSNSRPALACEVTAEQVLVARANSSRQSLESAALRPLPPNAVAPAFTGSNVQQPAALEAALSEAFQATGARGGEAVLVVPDAAVRVMLLDFDTLPEKQSDAEPLVRFRLKKLLPFDADRASISYHVQRGTPIQVIAAIADTGVLREYELALRNIGFNPGVVLPSVLAMLGAADDSAPVLVVKAETGTTAIAIVDGGKLRLLRTLETLTPSAAAPDRLAQDIFPSLVFFQDTYGTQVRRLLFGGAAASEALRAALEQQTGLHAEEVAGASEISNGSIPAGAFAGVMGALMNRA